MMTEPEQYPSELQVVHGCLSGDGESLRDFVSRFRQSVYGLCFRLLRHHQDAEDVVQDTFFRAISSLEHWDQQRPLRPWLLTIAANRCKTKLSRRSRGLVLPQQELAEAAVHENEQTSARTTELAEEIDLCLRLLTPKMQECFHLFYREQWSCAEIAEHLECPEGTVKTWLHRTRQQLTVALKQRGHQE